MYISAKNVVQSAKSLGKNPYNICKKTLPIKEPTKKLYLFRAGVGVVVGA
jgi:hypothetical protein